MADRSSKSSSSGKAAPLLEAGKIAAPKLQVAGTPKARSHWLSRLWSSQDSRNAKQQTTDPLDVTYWIDPNAEKRGTPRHRTRLRAGKIVDADNQFLSECVIIDRSSQGIRLRAVRPIALPPSFRLYDDLDKQVVDVCQVWSGHGEIGVILRDRWESAQATKHPCASLGAKYYAVTD
ncbi:MAG: hypothetical protein BGP04_05450 [Rhizobiales bacterium 62-17]|nr:hypothetical protein [Hyphomicrobiales bacterium]OJY02765.1 MAG: hypothetical protein BGP04_05450 [Rhizobiales bacterium 62-17]